MDFDGDNAVDTAAPKDQVTLYIYGGTKGTPAPMKIATGNLLRAVIYPDSGNTGTTAAHIDSDASDAASFAYNAQGQAVYKKDPGGTVLETVYDTGGRRVHEKATTLGSGIDGAVRRITTAYDGLGRVDTVTQFSSTTVGAPDTSNLVDQVQYAYDGWGNVSGFTQDPDSALGGSGRASFAVGYTYAKSTYNAQGTAGRHTVRRTGMSCPGGSDLAYTFLSNDANASRVTQVKVGATVVATYTYLGQGQLVYTMLDEPFVRTTVADPTTSAVYPGLDRFNRPVQSLWETGGGTAFFDLAIAYDEGSNITSVTDAILKNSGGNRSFDALYTIDGLNRLTRAEEGTLSGTISNRSRQEDWTLSQVGDWKNHKLDLNGDNDRSDSGEYQEDGTFNQVNELTTRELDTNNTAGYETTYSLAYDDAGNLTDDGASYVYAYDAWGRLRQVSNRAGPTLRAEYTYNGLNFRIGWHYDTDADGTVESNGDDPWYWFCHDERWRAVATFRGSDSSPKERFVFHNSGLGGWGGSSYIDAVILRDKDANTNWRTAAGDGTLEERRYSGQNWRSDASVLLTDTGKLVERVKYSSYGVPFASPAGDSDADGDWDATDAGEITDADAYAVTQDPDLDGDNDASDVTFANSITGSYQTLGRAALSSSAVNSRAGYAGYASAPELAGTKWHVRNRLLDSDSGRWSRRDPLGYIDGMNLYEYATNQPLTSIDSFGTCTVGTTCRGQPEEVYRPPHYSPLPPGVDPIPMRIPDNTIDLTIPILLSGAWPQPDPYTTPCGRVLVSGLASCKIDISYSGGTCGGAKGFFFAFPPCGVILNNYPSGTIVEKNCSELQLPGEQCFCAFKHPVNGWYAISGTHVVATTGCIITFKYNIVIHIMGEVGYCACEMGEW